jgi:hypothetical protein
MAKARPPRNFHKEDKKIQRKPSPHLDITNPGDRPVYKNGCITIQSSSNLHFLLCNLLLQKTSLTPKTFRENRNTEGRKTTKLSPKRQSNDKSTLKAQETTGKAGVPWLQSDAIHKRRSFQARQALKEE